VVAFARQRAVDSRITTVFGTKLRSLIKATELLLIGFLGSPHRIAEGQHLCASLAEIIRNLPICGGYLGRRGDTERGLALKACFVRRSHYWSANSQEP